MCSLLWLSGPLCTTFSMTGQGLLECHVSLSPYDHCQVPIVYLLVEEFVLQRERHLKGRKKQDGKYEIIMFIRISIHNDIH